MRKYRDVEIKASKAREKVEYLVKERDEIQVEVSEIEERVDKYG